MILDLIEIPNMSGAGRSTPSLRLLVGIIIGVVLLAFLGVVVVVALFCLAKRRMTRRAKQVKACYGIGKLILIR